MATEQSLRLSLCHGVLLRRQSDQLHAVVAVHEGRAADVVVILGAVFVDRIVLGLRQVGARQPSEVQPRPALLQVAVIVSVDELAHRTDVARFGGNGQPASRVLLSAQARGDFGNLGRIVDIHVADLLEKRGIVESVREIEQRVPVAEAGSRSKVQGVFFGIGALFRIRLGPLDLHARQYATLLSLGMPVGADRLLAFVLFVAVIDERKGVVRERVQAASEKLAKDAGCPIDVARSGLQRFLVAAHEVKTPQGRPPFAFKLHQFISGPGKVLATLEAPGVRHITLDAQRFAPGRQGEGVHLYPVHFCRDCGQEYLPVWQSKQASASYSPREIDDVTADDNEDVHYGFLCPADPMLPYRGDIEDLPETWLDLSRDPPKVKQNYKKSVPISVHIDTQGKEGSGESFWYIPGKFRFCLKCGQLHEAHGKDINRLASLSGEGRSSATTILTLTALRQLFNEDEPSSGQPEAAARLLECTPTGNLPADAIQREIRTALDFISAHPAQLEQLAQRRAQALLTDHRRVREAARDVGQYSVSACLPVDVMGV